MIVSREPFRRVGRRVPACASPARVTCAAVLPAADAMPAQSSTPSRARLALILGGLAMIGPFSIDTIFPAFPQIGEQFAADKAALQQTISAYLFAYALMSLVHGPLSDAIGRKRVILGGLTVFALASVGCALSTSLPTPPKAAASLT